MSKILKMKAERARVIQEARSIINKAEEEKRTLTEEEDAKVTKLMNEADQRDAEIKREERLQGYEEGLEQRDHRAIRPDPEDQQQEERNAWGSLGEQLQAVMRAAQPSPDIDERLITRSASGMSSSVNNDGGFLVQQDFSKELLKRSYETGILGSKCRKVPLSTQANGMKINAIDEESRANGSRWGGVQSFWEDEAQAITGSKPKFREINLNLRKLTGLCYATEELLQDAPALEAIIMQAFAEEFGFKVDDAILRGTGAKQPLGILNSNAVVKVPKETDQPKETVLAQNVINMWSRCWARSRKNAIWYINQEIEPQLMTMKLEVGTGGVPVYMPANGLSGQPYGTLFGRPVMPLEQCSKLGDEGDVLLSL